MPPGQLLDFQNPQTQDPRLKKTLVANGYEAFLYQDTSYSLVHYVITRKGEAEILMWGQEDSMEAAEATAKEWMLGFTQRAHG